MHICSGGKHRIRKNDLTSLLARNFKWEPQYEDLDTIPTFIAFMRICKDGRSISRIYFLNSRFRRIIDIRKSGKTVIQDRTIYEDAFIFAQTCMG